MHKKEFQLLDIISLKKSAWFLIGNYKTSFHGTGMEFDDLRIYNIWDDVKSIDWLASAKQDRIYIKKYKEERELPVLFVFALSSTMLFGTWETKKIDTVKNIFIPLALSALKNNNPIGNIFYNNDLIEVSEIKKWQINIWKTLKVFDNFNSENYFENSDYSAVIDYLFKKKTKNNLIFFFTDETNIEPNSHLRAISSKNDLIFFNISDSFENNLDWKWLINLTNSKNSLIINLNNKNKKLKYISERNLELTNLKKNIVSSGGSYIWVDNTSNIYKVLYNFFKLRQKII